MNAQKPSNSEMMTKLWRVFVSVILSIFLFMYSWAFNVLTDIPAKYPTKAELQCMTDRLERIMSNGFASQDSKIDELNKYLREHK